MKILIFFQMFLLTSCSYISKKDKNQEKLHDNICYDLPNVRVSRNCSDFNLIGNEFYRSILKLKFNKKNHCSTFFIKKGIALTAAHCVIENGNYTLEDYDGNTVSVSEVVKHPFSFNNFNVNFPYDFSRSLTFLGDIALLIVNSDLNINYDIVNVFNELDYENHINYNFKNILAYSIGYGEAEFNSSNSLNWTIGYLTNKNINSTDLNDINTPYIREYNYISEMKEHYKNLDQEFERFRESDHFMIKEHGFENYNPSQLVSAIYGSSNGGACLSGDSGSPVFIKINNNFYAYSINSFGSTFVFTNRVCFQTIIYPYLNWILNELKKRRL